MTLTAGTPAAKSRHNEYTEAMTSGYKTVERLARLTHTLDREVPGLGTLDALRILRWFYLERTMTESDVRVMDRAGVLRPGRPDLPSAALDRIQQCAQMEHLEWGDWTFHLKHRLHLNKSSTDCDFEALYNLVPSARHNQSTLERIIRQGTAVSSKEEAAQKLFYDLSILPINLLTASSTRYFMPPADYLEPHSTKTGDPYGIIHGQSRAASAHGGPTAVVDRASRMILGSHKFNHTLLFNIDFYCPIGCSDCYKTRMGTREYIDPALSHAGIGSNIYQHAELGVLNPPSKGQVVDQARRAVAWMNEDPRGQQVYDVIVSGGEPLWMSNDTLEAILDEMRSAKGLRILRICTGALFLGLAMRLDDSLMDVLKRFRDATGVRVTIQAHLGSTDMITPEAVIASQRIRRAGFSIYTQMPIKNGINFFMEDVERTLSYLHEFGRRQIIAGADPYMFIVDMHPSTNAFYVPIEPLMQVWGALVESHDLPGLERPRTLSILFQGGNIILSGSTLFAASKVVDREKSKVIYRIPRVAPDMAFRAHVAETFLYDEPLIAGINDDPESLTKLQSNWRQHE